LSNAPSIKPRAIGRPKSSQKREVILQCAGDLFLQQGYAQTSMDEVSKASNVSKQTVYSHFHNKETLYTAVIESKCSEYQIEDASICVKTTNIDVLLENIANKFVKLFLDPGVIDMHCVVIAEAKNNHQVADLFYTAGPLHSIELVAQLLIEHPQTKLDRDRAIEAAQDFFNLLKGNFHMRSILHLPYQKEDFMASAYTQRVVAKMMKLLDL